MPFQPQHRPFVPSAANDARADSEADPTLSGAITRARERAQGFRGSENFKFDDYLKDAANTKSAGEWYSLFNRTRAGEDFAAAPPEPKPAPAPAPAPTKP